MREEEVPIKNRQQLLIILTITLLAVRIPVAAIFSGRWGADSLWWSYPISSGLAAVFAVAYYKYGGWRSARMESPVAPVRPLRESP